MAASHERLFMPFQINAELMAATGKPETMFLHCLPAERGRECTNEVCERTRESGEG
jgi:ornithine carbamoyltransferase